MSDKKIKNKGLEDSCVVEPLMPFPADKFKKGKMSAPLEAALEAVEKMNKKDIH